MIQFKRILIAIGIVSALVLTFQNCSEVRVQPAPAVVAASTADTFFKATACPTAELLPGESTKFVFIVDMSVSNIGDWRKVPTGGKDKYGNPAYWSYFNKAGNTDVEGARFEAIKNFISTCGNLSGNQFAIVAFATAAGQIRNVNGVKSYKCDGKFSSSADAAQQLDELHTIQDQELPYYERWTNKPLDASYVPGILGSTNYIEALSCTENLMVNDLTDPISSVAAKNYEVFFVSDGTPKDYPSTGCEDYSKFPTVESRDTCYLDGIEKHVSFTMQAAIGKQKNIKFHSLYYSQSKTQTDPDDQLKKFMGGISRLGDTGDPLFLGRFSDSLKDGKNPLCELLGVRGSVEFRPEVMSLVNLSVKRVGGKLKVDSDLDGLTDEEEMDLGSDPQDAHSLLKPNYSDVLDGICNRVGGKDSCMTMRSQIQCSSTVNKLGVTECDLKILQINNLYSHPTLGLDTDKDGMADIVEILKGTDPGFADMAADLDGDLINNRQEILLNRDPGKVDYSIPAWEQNDYKVNYMGQQAGQCPYGAWQMTSNSLPGVLGLGLTNSIPEFNHAADENVFLISYRSDPRNSALKNIQFFGYILKVKYQKKSSGNGYDLVTSKTEILPLDFQLMGEVQP